MIFAKKSKTVITHSGGSAKFAAISRKSFDLSTLSTNAAVRRDHLRLGRPVAELAAAITINVIFDISKKDNAKVYENVFG